MLKKNMKNIPYGKLFCFRNMKMYLGNPSKINDTPGYIMVGWTMLMYFKQDNN